MVPRLSFYVALLSLGFNDILIEDGEDVIRISVHEEAEIPARVIQLLISMLRKQFESIFKGLKWQLLLVNDADEAASLNNVDSAIKKKTTKIRGVRPPEPVEVSSFDKFFSDEVGKLTTDDDSEAVSSAATLPRLKANESHVFISHHQAIAGDLAGLLASKLERRGVKCWLDKALKARQLNEKAMVDGVKGSHVYLILLTKDVFSRKPVLKELQTADENDKPIIAVKESEEHRPGYAPMDHFLGTVPSFCRYLFDKVHVTGMRRYSYEEDKFYTELIRSIATAK